MDDGVCIGVPAVYPKNPGLYQYFERHVTDILDFAQSHRIFVRKQLTKALPQLKLVQDWRWKSGYLPSPNFGFEYTHTGDEQPPMPGYNSPFRENLKAEAGLGNEKVTLLKGSVELDGTLEAVAERRISNSIAFKGHTEIGPGESNAVAGFNARYDAPLWTLAFKSLTDGNVLGLTGSYAISDYTAVGFETFYSLTKSNDAFSLALRKGVLSGGILSAIISASFNSYGHTVISCSSPLTQDLTFGSQLVYELSSYISHIRIGCDYKIPFLRSRLKLMGSNEREGEAAIGIQSSPFADCSVTATVSKSWSTSDNNSVKIGVSISLD